MPSLAGSKTLAKLAKNYLYEIGGILYSHTQILLCASLNAYRTSALDRVSNS